MELATPKSGPRLERADVRALGALAAITAFLFSDALRPGFSLWYRDIFGYWSMQAQCFVSTIDGGALPLWNPGVSFGLPMLADPSYQVAYPFTWLNLVLGLVTYYKLYVLAHACWAGAGLFLLLRRLGLQRPAAVAGAAAWIASGPFLILVSHTHHFAGSTWVPWVLLALDITLDRQGLKDAVLLGSAAAGQVLAGSGDLCLMTAFLCAGWLAARSASPAARPPTWRRLGLILALAAAVAAALSAVQWLPTLATLRAGLRLDMQDFGRLYWSLHPASLADFLVPRLVADLPLAAPARAALYESREPLFAVHYLGAAAAGLAAMGALGAARPLRAFAVVGFAATVFLALGRHAWLYPALARVTPLGLLTLPSKYVVLAGFCWALLVAGGIDAWLRGRLARGSARASAILIWTLAALALAAAAWVHGRPELLLRQLDAGPLETGLERATFQLATTAGLLVLAGALAWVGSGAGRLALAARGGLVLLALADLAAVGRTVNAAAPAQLLTARPSWAPLVPPGSRLYVSQTKEGLELARLPEGWEAAWSMALGRVELAWPPIGARAGFYGSYDGDFTGLAPPLLSNLTLILASAPGSPVATRLLRIAGVDFVIDASEAPWPELQLVSQTPSVLKGPVRLYAVPDPRPDAYFVGRALWAGEPRSFMLLADASFDPDREVVLAGVAPDQGDGEGSGRVRELRRRADRLELEVEASHPGFVVVLQTHDTAWRASLNGRSVPLHRANVLFQAVAVPAGRQLLTLSYRPESVVWGASISSAAALVLLGGVALRRSRRRAVDRHRAGR